MDSYIEVRLKPDAEMKEAELSRKIFSKFHKMLVKLNTNQIGLSFPEVQLKLGRLWRIHGKRDDLIKFQDSDWLGPLAGYCRVSKILDVPDNCKHRVISERRSNMSAAKLRRLIARGSISQEEQKRYKVKMLSQGYDNPYIDTVSNSTKQIYRKFFKFGDIVETPVDGQFSTYGLSKKATVPWF